MILSFSSRVVSFVIEHFPEQNERMCESVDRSINCHYCMRISIVRKFDCAKVSRELEDFSPCLLLPCNMNISLVRMKTRKGTSPIIACRTMRNDEIMHTIFNTYKKTSGPNRVMVRILTFERSVVCFIKKNTY